MFADPTINDFLDNIRWHLGRAINDAQRTVDTVKADAARRGLSQSGMMIGAIFDEVLQKFEGGIDMALGEVKRAVRITKLDPQDLR